MSKITEVEKFLQRHTTVGNLRPEQWTEAGEFQGKLTHRLLILWHAEPDKARFYGMSTWITVIEDEVRTKLRAMEVFIRVRERRLPYAHNAGVQTPDPAGGGIVPRREEAMIVDTGLNIDTAGRRKTLTQQMGDMGEPRDALRPKDMSRLVAIPTGRFNPGFTPVGHPGGAGTVVKQKEKKHKTQAGSHHIPSLMDVQVTGVNITESNCWPPMGRCASCGIEAYRCLRAPCIAQGRRCGSCGSRGHLARVCTNKMNLRTKRSKRCTKCKETTPTAG